MKYLSKANDYDGSGDYATVATETTGAYRYFALALGIWICGVLPAHAELALNSPVLPDEVLASQRGGFFLDNLTIAIGLEQIVAVNGETQIINRLTIPNLNLDLNQAALKPQLESQFESIMTPSNGVATGTVIQSGTLLESGGWLTTIQNDVDGIVIQNMRQLNIEINNLNSGQRLPKYFDTNYLQSLGR